MEVTVNLSGIKVHVGMYREGKLYQVDPRDVYVVDESGNHVATIDDPDKVGEYRQKFGWVSLRFLAEEEADRLTPAVIRDAQRDLITSRHAG